MLKLRKSRAAGFTNRSSRKRRSHSAAAASRCIVGTRTGAASQTWWDAISRVLGEQSHKMLRAERMSDCIFNGTAKRPPLGLAEVTLTLVDPELSDAVAKVIDGHSQTDANNQTDAANEIGLAAAPSEFPADPEVVFLADAPAREDSAEEAEGAGDRKRGKKRGAEKHNVSMRPGEVVIGRRLYRSGQSEYIINGRTARLRDVQEIFMGIGLGPDSYAIIEQGRIGLILNSKPMDRRAIIEEAAGITMYKTKRRLAETKLDASRLNSFACERHFSRSGKAELLP